MRGHKFLCLVDPTFFLEGIVPTIELCEQIVWSGDDAYMDVITVPHENFSDNLITIKMDDGEEYEFARDVEGRLHYVSDWWHKNEIIKRFEQHDT